MSEDYYKTYIFVYQYNGSRWGFELMASSPEDAQARFKALLQGEYKGELVTRTDVPKSGFFAKLWNLYVKGGSFGYR